jgi:hypothetical protein
VVDDRFRKFVMDHRASINDMIAQHWQLVDEHVNSQLRVGFDRCVEPCFLAFSCHGDPNGEAGARHEKAILPMIGLLLTAIKKRYYAFPDKHIVAVDQEILFDRIAPRAIEAGLFDESIEPIVLLFNAGEHLRELSATFYNMILLLVDIIAKHHTGLQPIIHVAAWLAGDAKRRAHALATIAAGQLPKEVLPVALFNGKIPAGAVLGRPIAAPLHDILALSLTSDPWLSPAFISEDPEFAKLVDAALAGKPGIPREVEQSLASRAAAKVLQMPGPIKFLGKAGRYEGFGGTLDSPPSVVGTTGEASLIARTASGRLFHVDYVGTGARIHVIGTTTCKEMVHVREFGLIALDQDGGIVALQDGRFLGTVPRPAGRVIAAGGPHAAFFLDQDAGIMYEVADGGGAISQLNLNLKNPIFSMAAIDDGRLAIVSGDQGRQEWTLDEATTSGKTIKIADLSGKSMVAACKSVIACLQPDGTILVRDTAGGTTASVPTFIDPATVTSFYITPREIITTHAFTYGIHFHGPPV